MKFRNETLKLGMRFYKFESDEDYRILTLVKLNDNDTAIFMDEETLKLHNINKETLDNEYTLLSDSLPFAVAASVMPGQSEEDLFDFIYNEAILTFANVREFKFVLYLRVYKCMKKAVFVKMVNYILNLNNLYSSLSDSNLELIWNMYFSYMQGKTCFLTISKYDNIDMEAVVDDNAKLPDSIFDKAEEYLNTYILSYDVYKFDDSVNIDNVNMKYFFIYDIDKDTYYIILYVIDTAKIAIETMHDLEENQDVVKFMLGQN